MPPRHYKERDVSPTRSTRPSGRRVTEIPRRARMKREGRGRGGGGGEGGGEMVRELESEIDR